MKSEPELLYEDEFSPDKNEALCIKQLCELLDKTMLPLINDAFEKVPTNHKRSLINKVFGFYKDN